VRYIGKLNEEYHTNLRTATLIKFIKDAGYTSRDAEAAIRDLEHAIAGCTGWSNLSEASAEVYSLLRYGTDVKQQGAVSKRIHFIDWNNPFNNIYELAEEVKVQTMGCGHDSRRPDLVLYVNGIALVVIELKKASVSVNEGMRQNYRNQQDGNIPRFFTTIQLAMAGNQSEGLWYGTTCTSEKFYLRWKEPTGSLADGIKQPGTFMDEPNELYRSVLQMIEPTRLLEFIHDLVIYDGGVKKLARPNQYFALKE
jgi:type I restriction enzyme R subunit